METALQGILEPMRKRLDISLKTSRRFVENVKMFFLKRQDVFFMPFCHFTPLGIPLCNKGKGAG